MTRFFRSLWSRVVGGTSVEARLARATTWAVVGNGAQQAFGMLAAIGTARLLGNAGFGQYGAVRSTTLVLGVLAGAGLGLTSTRYVASLRTADPERAGRVISVLFRFAWAMTLVASLICVVFAGPIAVHVMKSEELWLPLTVSAIGLMFSSMSGVQVGVLAGCEDFRSLAFVLVIEGFVTGLLTVTGAWLGGVTFAVAGYVLGTVLMFILRTRQVNATCRRANIPRVRFRDAQWRAELPIVRSFVLPAMLLSIGTQPAEWVARMMLARGPDGMAQLGIFTAAFSWASVVQFLPNQIAGSAMVVLSNVLATGDKRIFRRTLIASAVGVLGVAACIALPLALLSKWIMSLYGPSFRTGSDVMAIVVLAYALGAVTIMLRASSLSAGRAWLQFALSLVWGVALPAGFFVLRARGAEGLAISYGVAFVVLALLQLGTTWYLGGKSKQTDPAAKDHPSHEVESR